MPDSKSCDEFLAAFLTEEHLRPMLTAEVLMGAEALLITSQGVRTVKLWPEAGEDMPQVEVSEATSRLLSQAENTHSPRKKSEKLVKATWKEGTVYWTTS